MGAGGAADGAAAFERGFELDKFETAARELREAYRNLPIPPMRDFLASGDADGAYAIQAINSRYWQDQGRRVIGRKIGLTAKAVQVQLGVDQPDYGVLFDDMLLADGGELDPAELLQPKAEAEVALVLASAIDDPDATAETVAAAAGYAVAAIEIVDSRIADWKISFADTVADNGSSAFLVLGEERKPLAGLDLYTCGMAMTVNGAIVSVGAGAACLGHPLEAAAWLARTLARIGEGLRAGDIVMTGALGPMVAIMPGDAIEARIGGLGHVNFRLGSGVR